MNDSDLEPSERDLNALLQQFFAVELPTQLPPFPECGLQARHARSGILPKQVTVLAACAATLMIVGWLGLGTTPGRQLSTMRSYDERAVSGLGCKIDRREELDSVATTEAWQKDVVAFRWQRSYVDEPFSGTRVEVDLPQVTMNLPHVIVTTFPVTQ